MNDEHEIIICIKKYPGMPIDNATEIVRCRDCYHYCNHDKRCKYWNHGIDSNGYCHKGERRDDGTDK